MVVRHILKDGTFLTDITGHVVKKKEAEVIYTLLEKINQECRKEKKK